MLPEPLTSPTHRSQGWHGGTGAGAGETGRCYPTGTQRQLRRQGTWEEPLRTAAAGGHSPGLLLIVSALTTVKLQTVVEKPDPPDIHPQTTAACVPPVSWDDQLFTGETETLGLR